MVFKVGDKVRAVNAHFGWDSVSKGDIGEIAIVGHFLADNVNNVDYVVDFENRKNWNAKESDLRLVEPKKTKNQRITALEKKVEEIESNSFGDYEAIEELKKEVAELKLIAEGLRERKVVIPELYRIKPSMATFDEIVPQEEIIEFEGNQYRKVDREAKVGDYVSVSFKNGKCFKPNKIYGPVYEQFGGLVVKADSSDGSKEYEEANVYNEMYGRTRETVDVYELIVEDKQEFLPPAPKTQNQLRAEIIAKAKKFVDETVAYGRSSNRYKSEGNSTYRSNFYDVDFFAKGNKVTAVIYWLRGNVTRVEKPEHVGRAKCAPGDVFNEHIGKAIALGRALGLDVSEFEQAVQPNDVVEGHKIEWEVTKKLYDVVSKDGTLYKFYSYASEKTLYPLNYKNINKLCRIINDTNAQYETEGK